MKGIKKTAPIILSMLLILVMTGCVASDAIRTAENTKNSPMAASTEATTEAAAEESKSDPIEESEAKVPEESEKTEESIKETETVKETEAAETKESAAPAYSGDKDDPFGNDIPVVDKSELLDLRRCTLLESSGLLAIVEKGDNQYKLCDPKMNVLAEDSYIYLDDNNGFVTFAKNDGDNTLGLLDRTGRVTVPDKYGVIDVYNDHWVCAIVLTPGTDSEYDYRTFGGKYFLIDTVDLYFDGEKVKTLSRAEIDDIHVFGKYILFTDRDGGLHFCDSKMNETEPKYDNCYVEYYEDRNGKIWHLGSGTQAFTPECTLTPDDVDVCVYNKDGKLLDLQGNELADTSGYSVVYTFYDGYASIRDNGKKYGIIREDGTLISDCVFDEINMYEKVPRSGYVPAVLDGKFVIVSLRDGSYVETGYAKESMKSAYAPFASKVGDDGKYTLFSGLGKIDRTFDKATVNIDGLKFTRIQEGDGAGAVDMNGDYIIEPDGTYNDAYDMSLSDDGTVIVGAAEDGYYIYRLEY